MDSVSELAVFLAPRLAALPTTDATADAVRLFDGWDFTQGADSAPAAYFNAVWRQMVARMFDGAADTELIHASGGDRYWQVVKNIWDSPDDFWWDDKTVDGVQTRDETLQAAMAAAVDELTQTLGDDPASWRWGALHTLLLQQPDARRQRDRADRGDLQPRPGGDGRRRVDGERDRLDPCRRLRGRLGARACAR